MNLNVESFKKEKDYYKNYPNLVKTILHEGNGKINSILIDDCDNTKGTGFCNASLLNIDGKIFMNVRHVEYTFFYSQKFQSKFEGPLSYYHRDDDLSLRTNNYLGEFDVDTLQIKNYKKVDMSSFDVKPIWHFIGLEDARLVHWENKLFLVGVRRDTTTNGQGRMEFSEVVDGKEVSRTRVEPPDENSYCEKNWMPILDKPFHFVKWTNPTEIVKVDLETKKAHTVSTSERLPYLTHDMRGGTPVIPWFDDTYMCIIHECYFTPQNYLGCKDAKYKHRFVLWDKNFKIIHVSRPFDFMTGDVEFCIGLVESGEDLIISFGYYDSTCYAIKCKKEFIHELIWNQLSPL